MIVTRCDPLRHLEAALKHAGASELPQPVLERFRQQQRVLEDRLAWQHGSMWEALALEYGGLDDSVQLPLEALSMVMPFPRFLGAVVTTGLEWLSKGCVAITTGKHVWSSDSCIRACAGNRQ